MVPASVAMGIVIFGVSRTLYVPEGPTASRALALGLAILLGMASFFLLARGMRCEEMQNIWEARRRKARPSWVSPPGEA
jgi:hypothetical protein